ncbi:ESCRT-III subunit protein snf7 [Steccherinum ochraceum]|uniref:Vacuolar-sorting protein SNF7 n=1 Tax=Steccherinum ochraceum TaxID=92696 RepID=A0A4R0RNP0_9APHY|nr:ESCRT-III subunit protein snf7 [Steccherinum ochraceum]
MMAGFMSYFGGRRDTKQSTRDAIVTLRQQLQMIEKKEEYIQKKIETETTTARANAISNKTLATAALKRRKVAEQELDRLQGTKFQLETQVTTLESASFNAETMAAMKKAAGALKDIHRGLSIEDVDKTVTEIQDRMRDADEVAEAISSTNYAGVDLDTDDLQRELEELEQEQMDSVLAGAEHAPVHLPGAPKTVPAKQVAEEEDEETELKKLQAELAAM